MNNNKFYVKCDECGKEHKIFGESHIDEIAEKYNIKNVSKLPMDSRLAAACDAGTVELFDGNWLDNMANYIENL